VGAGCAQQHSITEDMQLPDRDLAGALLGACFTGCMVAFVLMRKLGQAHRLMPHQASIGLGVGLTILLGVGSAIFAELEAASPASAAHAKYVFLPQQCIFAAAVALRREAPRATAAYYAAALAVAVLGLPLLQSRLPAGVALSLLLGAPGLVGLSVTEDTLRHPLNLLAFVWMVSLSASAHLGEHLPAARALAFLVGELASLLIVKLQALAGPAMRAALKERRE